MIGEGANSHQAVVVADHESLSTCCLWRLVWKETEGIEKVHTGKLAWALAFPTSYSLVEKASSLYDKRILALFLAA